MLEQMQSHNGYTCMAFRLCAFSNVSSNNMHKLRYNYIGCICLTCFQCELSYASLDFLRGQKHSCIGCISLTFFAFPYWTLEVQKKMLIDSGGFWYWTVCSPYSLIMFRYELWRDQLLLSLNSYTDSNCRFCSNRILLGHYGEISNA